MNLTVRLISGAVLAAALYLQVPLTANQGEVGTLTINQSGASQWHKVETIHDYVNPVVILGPPTDNDPAPLAPRVRNLVSNSFELQLDPWNYLPQTHGEETISYLVIESGNHTLANGARIQAGIANGISTSTFSFQPMEAGFQTPPAVFAQVVTYNNPNPVTVQLHDSRVDRFTLRLLVEEARQGTGHPNEKVSWVAIEPSSMEGVRKYIAGISENKIGFEQVPLSFGSSGFEKNSPFFSHQRNYNDSDTATLRRKTIKSSSTIIYQQEEDSVNPENFHAKDFLGFLVFKSSGELPFVPHPPNAQDDEVIIPPMGMVNVDVLVNDLDPEEDLEPSTLELLSGPSYGTATVDTVNGRIKYKNTTATDNEDTLSYKVKDSLGQSSDPATLTIRFDNSNRLPNTTLNLPEKLSLGAYKLMDAFPGVPLNQPVNMAVPPGEKERLFVLEKGGRIIVIDDITSPSPQSKVFLDISQKVSILAERGLLGLAFHPDYANNRTFFIVYTDNIEPNPDPGPFGVTRHTILSRFKTSSGDPNKADLSSEKILIRMIDRDPGHQAGDLEFGPDGYLYMSSGDEGTQTDTFNNTQTITRGFHSGILRLDVDKKPGNPEPNPHPYINTDKQGKAYYHVPVDNPWVGATEFEGKPIPQNAIVRTEFYAVGLRNPWQMSFDPVTGELWVGDVGTATREEINRIEKGGNYQWAYKEGSVDGAKIGFMPPGFTGIPPIYEYPRPNSSAAVIGGIVYRGDKMIGLQGAYLFGDYQLNKIWSLRTISGGGGVEVEEIAYEGGITSFFADPNNGDPLISDFEGKIWRLVEDPAAVPFIAPNLTQTGVFADLETLTPNPGIYHYEPNVRFWSDHADKDRWFSIPEVEDTMTWKRDIPWDYPEGMVWIKHFDLELERGKPGSKVRVETRFLVKTDVGSYGLSYRWNEEQTEAFLVPAEGVKLEYTVITENGPMTQSWQIPARAQCLQCHTDVAGHALSFNTQQLNKVFNIFGDTTNQLTALEANDYFSNTVDELVSLPRYVNLEDESENLTERVRSYLAVNCVSCHQPGGTGLSSWDARYGLSLVQTKLINGFAGKNGGNPDHRLVVPGNPDASILLSRISGCCGFTRMPPLASTELDQEAIDGMTEWINSLDDTEAYRNWRLDNFGSDSSEEGEPTVDADSDQYSNYMEFLLLTEPKNIDSFPDINLDLSSEKATLIFETLSQRSLGIEISHDLINWEPWNLGGLVQHFNQGEVQFSKIEGPIIQADSQKLFFRVSVLWVP